MLQVHPSLSCSLCSKCTAGHICQLCAIFVFVTGKDRNTLSRSVSPKKKPNKTHVTRNSVMIENLRRIYKEDVKQVLNQQALTGAEAPLRRRLFLFLQLNQFLTALILTVMSSRYGNNSFTCVTHESAHVLLLSHGCGQITAAPGRGCTCVSCGIWFELKIFFPCLSSLSSLWLSLSGWSEAGFGSVGGQI